MKNELRLSVEVRSSSPALYGGLFLIALSTLTLEITLTRILSVITWYHLAFFAISIAMLGMTAGAVTVYIKRSWFGKDNLFKSLAAASLGYAISVPIALILLCRIPITLEVSVSNGCALLISSTACTLPFYFSGIAVSGALTRSGAPPARAYASDLVGAALGCLLVLAGLEWVDAPSLIILCGSIGALAAVVFAGNRLDFRWRNASVVLFLLLYLGGLANSLTPNGIRLLYSKGNIEDRYSFVVEKWNSFSRVAVEHGRFGESFYWGKSPIAPPDLANYKQFMKIDGEAGTAMTLFSDPEDLDYLKYDVTNMVYALRPTGGACIIGVGGGRDLQSAVLFGHQSVVGIDINPIFVNLLTHRFRSFAGLAGRPGVTFVVDEARSYLSRISDQYSVLQMSLIDTWAATGAGAFSLSENALYTTEAWQIFLDRLKPEGVFTVSRWYNPSNLGETGRLVALATEALLERGVADPSRQIALIAAPRSAIATLLVGRQPFSEEDLKTLAVASDSLQFSLAILPGRLPQDPTLAKIIAARSIAGLHSTVASEPMNFLPPTDENPYFFNMVRLQHLRLKEEPGIISGNIRATIVLLVLILVLSLLCFLTIIVPLRLVRRRSSQRPIQRLTRAGGAYFSLIGAGFMFLEIGFIQRLSVFLGHPIYALGVLLFALILSAGFGSYLSNRIFPRTLRALFVLPILMVSMIGFEHGGLLLIISGMITASLPIKILLSIILITPAGIVMGFFFPTGMRLLNTTAGDDTPWFWALNGVFGVLASALAVFLSIYSGITTNFVVAAVCYGGTIPCLWQISRDVSIRDVVTGS